MKEKITIKELSNRNGYLTITDTQNRVISVKIESNKGSNDWFVGDIVELEVKPWKDKLFGNIPKVFPNQSDTLKRTAALSGAIQLVCACKVEIGQLEKSYLKLLKLLNN